MNAKVIDSFNVQGRVALEYGASGVVAIVQTGAAAPRVGELLLIVRPDGWMLRTAAIEVKPNSAAVGLFLANLTKQQVPIGSEVRWGDPLWPGNSTASESAIAEASSR